MYDVYFGGKRMTKRLTIALVALVALVLVAVLPASATFYSVNSTINQGASIYLGEQGLNVTHALNQAQAKAVGFSSVTADRAPINTTIGWWASAAAVTTTSATKTLDLSTRYTNLWVLSSDFNYQGAWYLTTVGGTPITDGTNPIAVFTVVDPSLALVIWDADQSLDVSGSSVIQGENLTFRVDTNMYSAIDPNYRTQNLTMGRADGKARDSDDSHYVDIKVKTDSGNTLTKLYTFHTNTLQVTDPVGNVTVTAKAPNTQPWYLNGYGSSAATGNKNWSTDAYDQNGQYAYPAGTYTVWTESYLNGMYDNYKSGSAAYTGKTVSETKTITLVSNTVKIEANKDSVVRSKAFSVTVTGKPNQVYHLWVKGTSTMAGGYDDQPPMIAQNQAGVYMDSFDTTSTVGTGLWAVSPDPATTTISGGYTYQNGVKIWNDVAKGSVGTAKSPGYISNLGNGTYVYANITLNDKGTRTIGFTTTNWTKAQKYTIRVENEFGTSYKSDEVDVKVEKGAVTIVAAGDQSYYLGEEVKFSGTNTESQTTYLFISGPNLGDYGAAMSPSDLNPRDHPLSSTDRPDGSNTDELVAADVQGDNTWSYKWGTASIALDAGTYTIYATSQPSSSYSDQLSTVAYGTVSIIIKKPFISAVASQSTVAKGDAVFITGTAQGSPTDGIRIWILGKNKAIIATEAVNSDASFSYELKKEVTKDLYSGQYFIVAQHPMQNNRFDVYPGDSDGNVVSGDSAQIVWTIDQSQDTVVLTDSSSDFRLSGKNSLQGSDAAEALIEAINDANVDDTYTKLQILVEEPVITVDTVGDRHVGDKFTITATTNLAVDDEVLVEVYSSSFQPTQKSQSGEFSGATGTIKVTKGDSGLNKLSFDVDASTFKPDEYLVKETAVLQDATGTSLFNVLEAAAPTATPTAAVTTSAPVTVATTIPPTTVATPTKTPTQPGFGALVALIGLGAVALLVVRRH
jgi:PGF-CTERM protein